MQFLFSKYHEPPSGALSPEDPLNRLAKHPSPLESEIPSRLEAHGS